MVENIGFGQSFFLKFKEMFPDVATIKYGSQFMIYLDGEVNNCVVEFLGPFVFALSVDKTFARLLYIPHYIIRVVPHSPTVELLPYNPHIRTKILFTFINENQKSVITNLLNTSRNSTQFYPTIDSLSKFSIEGSVLTKENLTPTQVTLEISLEKSAGKITITNKAVKRSQPQKYLIDINTSISTLCEETWIPATQYPFGFAIHEIDEQNIYFVSDSMDLLYTAFLFLDCFIRHVHAPILMNNIPRANYAAPFPQPKILYYWPEPTIFTSTIKDYTVQTTEEKHEIKFKSHINVPDVATSHVSLLDYNHPIRRTILFQDSFNFYNKKFIFQPELPVFTKEQVMAEETERIINDIQIPDFSFEIELPEEKEANSLPEPFLKSGEELLIDYISLPSIDQSILDYSDELKLNDLLDSEGYPEQRFLAELQTKITSLPLIIKTSDPEFIDIFTNCFNVMNSCVNVSVLFDAAYFIANNDSRMGICIPENKDNRLQRFCSRLLEKRLLSRFISIISSDPNIIKSIYSQFSPLCSDSFLRDFIKIICSLEKHIFRGKFVINNLSTNFIPNNAANSVWQEFKNLSAKLVKNMQKPKDIAEFFLLISKFVNEGFIRSNTRDILSLFPNTDANSKYSGTYSVAYQLIQVFMQQKAHFSILDIAKTAADKKCYVPSSPMCHLYSVMVVSQALLDLSKFDLQEIENCLDFI